MSFLDVVIKIAVAFIIISIYMRISSNSQLSPLTASDQVGNIVLGAIVGGALAEEVKTWMLILAMILWCALQLFLRWGKYRSSRLTAIIDGERIPLIREGKIDLDGFNKTKLLPEDFVLTLHKNDIVSIDDVWNAWFETDGTTSIDKKGEREERKPLISNGTVLHDGLRAIGKNKEWLEKELKKKNLKIESVFVAEWYDNKLEVYPL